MKTKTLRLPVLFASAGAILWTVSAARAADSLEIRQDSSTSQKEVINEPSGAERTYSTRIESGPAYDSSYRTQTYESGQALDPDTEGDRIMHMYQRGRHAAESLDRQIKPNPIVVMPGTTTFESTAQYPPNHLGELHQQSYSSSFNEPAAAERESSSSTSTTRRYSTESTASSTDTSATLSSGTTIKVSDLIGMNIKNSEGERIGEVKDAVLDLKSGRVAYTVVSAGGIAGLGDKWLAVPPSLFARTGTEKTLTWDIDKQKLSSAPTIDKHNWNAAFQQDYIGDVYSFYGVENYEANEPAGSQKKSDTQYHHDSEQQNRQDKQEQDKDQSRNDARSSSSQAAASQSSEQSELQKSQPEKSASSSADVSKEAAGAQPYSSSSSSASGTSSSATEKSSSSAELKASTDVNAPAGAQSSSSSSEDTKTEPQSSSTSASVSESAGAASGSLPEKAQMALKNDASLSGSAQNVQLEMKEDKLCVKGTVKTEDEKNRILEKVRATAGDTKIDDQLKVSASSDSNDSDNDK